MSVVTIKNEKTDDGGNKPWDFSVDRRSPLGCPFYINSSSTRDEVCDLYDLYFEMKLEENNPEATMMVYLEVLYKALLTHGRLNLWCHCAPLRCHAETIKKYLEKRYEDKDTEQ